MNNNILLNYLLNNKIPLNIDKLFKEISGFGDIDIFGYSFYFRLNGCHYICDMIGNEILFKLRGPIAKRAKEHFSFISYMTNKQFLFYFKDFIDYDYLEREIFSHI